MSNHRYPIFPIFHKHDKIKRGLDHWTVLVMDTERGKLRFYNSLRPRTGHKDPYLEDAKEVVSPSRIGIVFNFKLVHVFIFNNLYLLISHLYRKGLLLVCQDNIRYNSHGMNLLSRMQMHHSRAAQVWTTAS